MEHLKGASLGYALALPAIIRLGWKGLPRTNTLSLLQGSFNSGNKKPDYIEYDTQNTTLRIRHSEYDTQNCDIEHNDVHFNFRHGSIKV